MLFFKRKQKADELLPPPPPDLDSELEQELEVKPKFFDETVEPEKTQTFPEELEFTDLIENLEGKKPAKVSIRKEKVIEKKPAKKPKAQSKEIVQLKKKLEKLEPVKKYPKKAMQKQEKIKKQRTDDELYELKNKELEFPKEALEKDDFKAFDALEDFDLEEFKTGPIKNLDEGFNKSKEILEAEDEIKGAIEKIKAKEKPSFFRNLFAKKEAKKRTIEAPTIPKPLSAGSVSFVQNKISEAKQSLTRLDLENAKTCYIEIIKCYNNLKPEEQAKVYSDIRGLYFERKNAEGLKV